MVTHTGRGLFLGSQSRHCICTYASRGLSATAEFLVRNTTLLRSEPIARFLEEEDEDEEQQQPYAASVNTTRGIYVHSVEMQIHAEFAGNYISCDVQCLRI